MADEDKDAEELERCIGRIMINLPRTAKLLRHARPLGPLRGNYVKLANTHAERIASEYLYDLVTMTTDEILAKWELE